MKCSSIVGLLSLLAVVGCASQDIPQAYRGRMFDKSGFFAFYSGGHGFTGPILGPGTYFTGTYNELRLVQCSMVSEREPLTALTKDGVQFGLDVYIRFSANCTDAGVKGLLDRISPDETGTITAKELYAIFIRSAVGAAVREVVSPYRANDVNENREAVLAEIRRRFIAQMNANEKEMVVVYDVDLSNLDFPDAMDAANVDRAVQAVLKDKAIAERERVQAEFETAKLQQQLSTQEAENVAVRIERVGDVLRRYPEYLQYDLQSKLPDIYREAGNAGNLIIAAPNPIANLPQPHGVNPATRAAPAQNSITGHGPSAEHSNPINQHPPRAIPHEP